MFVLFIRHRDPAMLDYGAASQLAHRHAPLPRFLFDRIPEGGRPSDPDLLSYCHAENTTLRNPWCQQGIFRLTCYTKQAAQSNAIAAHRKASPLERLGR